MSMKKEPVNKFDLEAAFKALDEINVPVVRGIRPNRENLQEKFAKKKLVTDTLVEDYYDINDSADLEAAQEDREAEIAKAKLARIEKIVDLEAESEEDLLPSYVGKVIIQCPQCMTLFYKNQEDISKSEENPEVVNINEVCQHCGNSSGYTLIGKVDTVGEEEAEQYDLDAFEDDELNLDFPEETEEVESEETSEATGEEENTDVDLDLNLEEPEEEPAEEEEEVKESVIKQRIKLNNRSLKEAIIDDIDNALYTPGVWGVEFVGEECILFDNEQEARDYFYSLTKDDIYRDSEGIELFTVINEDGDTDTIDAISIYDDEETKKESLNEAVEEENLDDIDSAIASRRGPIYVDKDGNCSDKDGNCITEDADEEIENEEIEDKAEVVEEPVEEILTSVEEIKEVAVEAAEAVLNASEEETLEDIKNITDTIVEDHFEISEDEVEEIKDEEIKESLNEEAPKTIIIRKPGTKDETIEVPVIDGYAEYEDENGNIKKIPVAEALTESTAKQRLTVIEPGYQYKDKDGNIYTLYGDECEEDATGITYNWDFVDDENGDIYIFLVESLTEDVDKEVKIAGFVDCSGSNGEDSVKNQRKILKAAGATEIYYFSDKIYTDPESAWQGGRTLYSEIKDWVENNPEAKAIVTTDSDIDFNDGYKIKNHDRIKIIRFDVQESLTEDVDKELDAKLKAHNEYIDYLKDMIKKEEKSLSSAKNDFVKKSIQSRIDALKADLEAALPESLKGEIETELPTAEEIDLEATQNTEEKEETTESLTESRELDRIAAMREKAAKKGWFEVPAEWFNNEEFKLHMSDSILLKAIMYDKEQNIYFFEPHWKEDIIEIAKRCKIEVNESLTEDEEVGLKQEPEDRPNPNYSYKIKYSYRYTDEQAKDDKPRVGIKTVVLPSYEEAEDFVYKTLSINTKRPHEFIVLEVNDEKYDSYIKKLKKGNNAKNNKEESLVEADLLDAVFDSEEFNKPISDEEVRGILSSTKFHENFNLDLIEEFDENSFDNHINNYLKEVYENVAEFKTTTCETQNNKFIIEGVITFKSGNTRNTKFKFEAIDKTLVGTNIDLAEGKAFTVNYKIDNNKLITENFKYDYKIKGISVKN